MQSHTKKVRCIGLLCLLGTGCILFLLCSVLCGSIRIPLSNLAAWMQGGEIEESYRRIILEIRFPRAVSAMVLGGALALSGYLLQTFFHNPIAGPFVLGISSGAKLAVALVLVFCLGSRVRIHSFTLILAAFAGAMLSMSLVLLLAGKVQGMSMLIVSGVMIGYISSAVTDFVVTFAEDADIANLHNWSQGSFSGMAWSSMPPMLAVVFASSAAAFFLSKPIGAYQLGEGYAKSVGVCVNRLRILLILLSSLLSACTAAYAGPISFVGIAVPYLVKRMLGTGRPIWMIPGSFLGGGLLCLLCDLIARSVFAPTELGISTVTAVFGAPIVLWMMTGRRKEAD